MTYYTLSTGELVGFALFLVGVALTVAGILTIMHYVGTGRFS